MKKAKALNEKNRFRWATIRSIILILILIVAIVFCRNWSISESRAGNEENSKVPATYTNTLQSNQRLQMFWRMEDK